MTETKYWTAPDGKQVKYFETIIDRYQFEGLITFYIKAIKWPKNTSLVIEEWSGDCEAATDSEYRWLDVKRILVGKMPHEQFDAKKYELIQKAQNYINQLTGEF